MVMLCRVKSVGELTKIPTAEGGGISKIELQLDRGFDTFQVAAFDKVALEIATNKPTAGVIYYADLTFSVSGKEKLFQNVRLNHLVTF